MRETFEALNRADVEGVLGMFAPSFEVDWTRSGSGMNEVYTDKDALGAAWLEHWSDPWEWVEWEVLELDEVDESTIVCVSRARMKGRGSGAEVEATGTTIWTFEDGLITRSVLYQSRDEAYSALDSGR